MKNQHPPPPGKRPGRKSKSQAAETKATIGAAARELGVNERTLRTWKDRGCPWTPGAYDVTAIEDWRQRTLRAASAKDADEWEMRRRAAAAQREELRLSRERRELLEVKLAVAIVGQHAAEVRAHLDQLPELIVSLVRIGAKEKRSLLARVRAKVRELCEGFEMAAKRLAEAAERDT